MDVVTNFLSWTTLIFGIFIYAVVLMIRRVVETYWVKSAENKWWHDVILPSLPMVLGTVTALCAKQYPVPPAIQATSARVFYGAVVGFTSAWMYRVMKAMVKKQWGIDPDMSSLQPPPLLPKITMPMSNRAPPAVVTVDPKTADVKLPPPPQGGPTP